MIAHALAGVPVALPPGEPVSAWHAAFELADLDPSPAVEVGVRFERGPEGWRVRVRAPGGAERIAMIPPPTTPAAREDAALTAAALARELGLSGPLGAPAPRALLEPPPPPAHVPETRAIPRAPAPAAPEPELVAPEPVPEPVAPEPTLPPEPVAPEPALPPEPVAPEPALPPEPARAPAPLPPPVETAAVAPAEPRPPAVSVAPLHLAIGLRGRDRLEPGFEVAGGVTIPLGDRLGARLEVGGAPARRLDLPDELRRRQVSGEALISARLRALPGVVAEATGGAAWRVHRQQRAPIDRAWIPLAGLGAELTVLDTPWGSVGARLRVVADLVRTRWVDETGTSLEPGLFEGSFDLVVATPSAVARGGRKKRAAGDPIAHAPTSLDR